MESPTLLVVLNPQRLRGRAASSWSRALTALRAAAAVEVRETLGDGADQRRIGEWLETVRPSVAVAAGGDGTVGALAAALMGVAAAKRPPLGIIPLGTANNVARSLGLTALRGGHVAAARSAVGAILGGATRLLDLGQVDGRWFVGSFAIGMDGEILALRNRWRSRLARRGGYPLYLLSCAVNLARHRGAGARLAVDGVACEAAAYNLLVLNTALYAGEFRFDGADASGDGRLDLHVFTGASDYVGRFVAAWRRHLAAQRGAAIVAPPGLQRITQLSAELARPLASQIDGEEGPHTARFTLAVHAAALQVCVPGEPSATRFRG